MKRLWLGLTLLAVLVGAASYWLVWGRTVVLTLDGRDLSEIVDLSCFGPLHPDMRRSQVTAVMGEPYRVQVTDVEYGQGRAIDYQEIRWAYQRGSGVLAYYVEEYDIAGGSVEYVPESMRVTDFFRIPLRVGSGKRFVEIRDASRSLIHVRLQSRNAIERINWYSRE